MIRKLKGRRGGRVVEGAPLLREYTRNGIEGSNPFLSAMICLQVAAMPTLLAFSEFGPCPLLSAISSNVLLYIAFRFYRHICAPGTCVSAICIDDKISVILTYLALLPPILSIVANFHQYQRNLTQVRLISCQLACLKRRLELTETKHIRSQSKKCVICATTASEHDCGKPEFEFS